jgi:hypothetical protein
MKANDRSWTAILDPRYSVLALPHGLGRVGARYLDIATGWQESRRNRPSRSGCDARGGAFGQGSKEDSDEQVIPIPFAATARIE